jgi:uncharacterized membrane protein
MRTAMTQLLKFLRVTVVGGLLFLVPFIILAIIVDRAMGLAHKIVAPLAAHLPVDSVIGIRMEKILAVTAILLFCFAAGCFARTNLAKRIIKWIETTLLCNVPGYQFFKMIGESLLGTESTVNWQVVLVRMDDTQCLGFLVERLNGGAAAVFVPDAPNPHSGSLHFVTADHITSLSMTPAAAMKCLKRLGAGSGALLGQQSPSDNIHH